MRGMRYGRQRSVPRSDAAEGVHVRITQLGDRYLARREGVALDARDAPGRPVERTPNYLVCTARFETDSGVRHRHRCDLRVSAVGRHKV